MITIIGSNGNNNEFYNKIVRPVIAMKIIMMIIIAIFIIITVMSDVNTYLWLGITPRTICNIFGN